MHLKCPSFVKRILTYDDPRASLWYPVALACGIAIYFSLPAEPNARVLGFAAFVMLLCLLAARGGLLPRLGLFLCLGLLAGFIAAGWQGTPMIDWPKGPVRVGGTVAMIEPYKDGFRLLLEQPEIEGLAPKDTPLRVRTTLRGTLAKKMPDLDVGDQFSAVAKVLPLSSPMLPDGFDFRRNAYFDGIGATGYVMGKIEVAKAEPNSLPLLLASMRIKVRDLIQKNMKGDRAGLAAIFLTGQKSLLAPETAEAMRAIGLAHLLAIAGLHIGLVAGIVFGMVRGFLALIPYCALRWPIKKIAAFCAMLAIGFYTLQVGAPVPTRRAFIMAGFVLLGILVDRVTFSLRTISLAALIILLLWPAMLMNPGFQLSFAAVLGLIAVSEMRRDHGSGLFAHVQTLVIMSFVAMIATYPFALYHFQEGGLYSVLANSLAIPLTSFLIMPLCVFVFLSIPFGLEAPMFALLDRAMGLLLDLSHVLAALPGAHALLPPISVFWTSLAAAGGLFFCLTRWKARWIGVMVLLASIGCGLLFSEKPVFFAAPDGMSVGWADEGRLIVASAERKPSPFMTEIWARRLALSKDKIEHIDESDPDCDVTMCMKGVQGFRIGWAKTPDAMAALCEKRPDFIMNPWNETRCAANIPVWTFENFTKQGAVALFVRDGRLDALANDAMTGSRPWSLRATAEEELSKDEELR